MSDEAAFASGNDSRDAIAPDAAPEAVASPVVSVSGCGDAPDPDLQKLRELLFLREMELLRKLEKRLDDPMQHARETSEVIAEALLLRTQKDNMLFSALEPTVEKLFKEALRKSPMDFVNALFPLMGPAIRRSIAETFRSMLEGFHKTMEQVFSWKGLRWRWRALRTGVSFSEVVLLHTLLYRVEQIFFIHAQTGLVLSHVYHEGVAIEDADMVSGMLTAIQDFARDCFAGREGSLDSLQMGNSTILVERGTTAYLACVVRGTASLEFRERLRDAMAAMQIKYLDELNAFSGDAAKFASARWDLEDLLDARYVDEDAPLPFWVKLVPVALVLLLLAGAGYGWYEVRRQDIARRHVEESIAQVGQTPGILLVEARRDGPHHWEVIYQKDPLAEDPKSLLDVRGIDPETYTLRVIPYISYEAGMITRRVKERITPPDGVTMEFDRNGTLYLRGKAPMSWILQARQEALSLPGVEKIDTSGLSDPRVDELKRKIALVEATVVGFPLGKDTPVSEDAAKLARAMDTLVEIEKLAGSMNVTASLTIYGHADATGSAQRNYEISQARAKTIAAMLYARGSSIPVAMYGLGAEHASKEEASADSRESGSRSKTPKSGGDQGSRKVELRVHLAQLPSDTGLLNLLR
ncbi:MAG: OmpA family protein [Candidatus Accumulibacter sp.]|jgi:OOP family OmpA-OmpF porin|nr:OmpA family protein [Accumulibacter sp.]